MASDVVPLPPNFADLAKAIGIPPLTTQFNVIGVCVELLEPIKCTSGKQDWKASFTLHDPRWLSSTGMEFSYFSKHEGAVAGSKGAR